MDYRYFLKLESIAVSLFPFVYCLAKKEFCISFLYKDDNNAIKMNNLLSLTAVNHF